ncbi:hypothetical protein HOA92_07450 [archaeon]|jgi:hypothetical protein|nr:hypothetical protein [archaeon]MBT6762849.1 hypothetical protein [archaeon]
MQFDETCLIFHGTTEEYLQSQFRKFTGLYRGEPTTGSPLYFGALERVQPDTDWEEPLYRGAFIDKSVEMPMYCATMHAISFKAKPIMLITNLDLIRDRISYDNSCYPLIRGGWPERTFIQVDLSYIANFQEPSDFNRELLATTLKEATANQKRFKVPENIHWDNILQH